MDTYKYPDTIPPVSTALFEADTATLTDKYLTFDAISDVEIKFDIIFRIKCCIGIENRSSSMADSRVSTLPNRPVNAEEVLTRAGQGLHNTIA